MSFFGAVFAALTMYWQWHFSGAALAVPFAVFMLIGLMTISVIRMRGSGIIASEKAERAIMWSSIGEGVGLFLAANIVINLRHPELLLPAMALVVGVHFLPIAFAANFPPFYFLAAALIVGAIVGFAVPAARGGEIAGFIAAASLWVAAIIAVHRDWAAKRSFALGV